VSYPQQPGYGQPPQGYPPAQQQGYAQPQYQQQPSAAPYQGQAAGPYQGQPQPQQGYAPQQPYQGYPPVNQPPQPGPYQGQPQPQAPPPSAPSTVRDFWDQPSTGGKALSFERVGTRYVGTVIRTVTDADIQDQTDIKDGTPSRFNDGRPKKMMLVPLLLHQPTPEFPDGVATWYVKGNNKSELTRAMEAAGIAPDPETGYMPVPRAGDVIDITFTHEKAMGRGMNAMKVLRVAYTAGNGTGPDMSQVQQAPPVQQPYQQPQTQYAQMQPNVYQAGQGNGYMTQQPGQAQPQFQQYAQQPAPGTAYQPPPQQYQQAGPAAWDPNTQAFPPGTFQQPPPYPTAGGAPIPGAPGPAPIQQAAPAAATGYQQVGPVVVPAAQPQFDPAQAQQFQQQHQQPSFPTQQPGPGAQGAPAPYTNGAQPTGPASPSYGPPPDWPADVPFREGLTVGQARLAALHNIGQPQQ